MDRTKITGVVLVGVLLLTAACTGRLSEDDSGQVAMRPFFREGAAVRGVEPVEGWSEMAQLVQDVLSGTVEDMQDVVLERTSWTEMPEPIRTYRGRTLTWQIYSDLGQVYDVGEELLRVDVGLAQQDSRAYIVALLSVPEHHAANPEMYSSVFTHAMYALEPMP